MSTAYDIVMMETLGLTAEQAALMLDSGLPMYRNFRRYLERKSKGMTSYQGQQTEGIRVVG